MSFVRSSAVPAAARVARAARRVADAPWRAATAPLRALPTFLIIGAQKAGTTSLYHLLTQAPGVVPAARKEVQFFHRFERYQRGPMWYRRQFPVRWPAGPTGTGRLTGEATPLMWHPHAARRVREVVPAVKLIAVLRDPVDRAFSHHQQQLRRGVEHLEFGAAIEAEEERLHGELERMLADETYTSRPYDQFSYLTRGRYAEQLERWLHHFDRDQLHVVFTDDLFGRPDETWDGLATFLGLDTSTRPPMPAENVGDYAAPVDPALRDALLQRFEADDATLAELLGRRPAWRP